MKKQDGFSLIELILYMGLTSILIGLMSQVFLAILSVRVESANTSGVQQDGRYIMTRLGHDIRKADAILSPGLGIASSSMTLILTESGVPQTYRYEWDGETLMVFAGANSVSLSSNRSMVTDFSVTRIGNSATVEDANDTLSITLVVAGNSQIEAGQQSLELHTTVSLR